MKKKKTVQRLISELDDWIARPRNREILLERSTKSLHDYLAGKLEGSIKTPIAALSNVASWLGQSGAHRLLHGDLSGWDEIAASLHYLAWNERTLFEMLGNGTAKSVQVARSVFALLHGICTGQDEMAAWFGNRLVTAFKTKDERITGWSIPLRPFSLHILAKWQKLPFAYSPADTCALGVYQDLLDGWDNQADFRKCLMAACDYHVNQAFDDSKPDTQDFFFPLYQLFPVEILAVGRVRECHAEVMPDFDHPLMTTGLGNLPECMPRSQDELLQAVSLKVCKDFGIGNPWDLAEAG